MPSNSYRRWSAAIWVTIVLGAAGGVAGVIAARGRPPHAPPRS